ncbi:O-antigen ligase family protein [Paenibacillus sp. LjRoot153]|uniref:O-antigen ligase family protein n=1 Tax=Paenibacillus sp. LjRoot153 TaxID=3342270 RepID=UPI003ECCED68
MKIKFVIIFYLALICLPFDEFPFGVYGFGVNKPLSLYIFLLFLILNIPVLLRLRYKNTELIIFSCILFLIICSFYISYLRYNSIDNQYKVLNEFLGGVITYLSFKAYADIKDEKALLKMFKIILGSYILASIFGIIEFVYIYIAKSDVIISFLQLFLSPRFYGYLYSGHRIQFSFGEPSFIGFHLFLVVFPIILLLNFKGYKIGKLLKFNTCIFLLLSFISLSGKFILDFLVFILAYIFLYKERLTTTKFKLLGLLSIVTLIGGFYLLNYTDLFSRFQNGLYEDSSGRVRSDLSIISLIAIKDHQLMGYGLGNFLDAFKNNISYVDESFGDNYELVTDYYLQNFYLHCYNMYGRILTETGIVGVFIFILIFFKLAKYSKHNFNKFVSVLLLYNLLQVDTFSFFQLSFWIALFLSPSFWEFLNMERKGEQEFEAETKAS